MEGIVAPLAAFGAALGLLSLGWLLGRRFSVVRKLALSFILAAIVAGLTVFAWLAPDGAPLIASLLRFLQFLLLAVTLLGVARLFFFEVFLYSKRGFRLPPILSSFAIGAAYFIAALAILKYVYPDEDLSFILSAGAVTSLVIGLALQPILTNLFAGVVISLEQPFRINDWIRVGDRDGQVIQITWRTTHLRNRNNDNMVIPNSQIADQELINYHYPNPLHMERIDVGVHYRTPPHRVRQAMIDSAGRVPGVMEKPSPDVFLKSFDDSAITYELRIWLTDVAGLQRICGQVRVEVWEEFQRQGITIPFPIRTLEIEPTARTIELVRGRREPAEKGSPVASLFVTQGRDRGRVMSIDTQPIRVGRSSECDFTLAERSASKEHFRIEWTGKGYVLSDLKSQHGTKINGVAVNQDRSIHHLDRIQIGETEIVFESNE